MAFASLLNKVPRMPRVPRCSLSVLVSPGLECPGALSAQMPLGPKCFECLMLLVLSECSNGTTFRTFLNKYILIKNGMGTVWEWWKLKNEISRVIKTFELAIIWFRKSEQSLYFAKIKFRGWKNKSWCSQHTVPTDQIPRK